MSPDEAFRKIVGELNNFKQCFMERSLQSIKDKTPVRTGTLRDGWYIVDGNTITNDVEYAPYIEFGTRYIQPVGMVRRTRLEAKQIADRCGRETLNK